MTSPVDGSPPLDYDPNACRTQALLDKAAALLSSYAHPQKLTTSINEQLRSLEGDCRVIGGKLWSAILVERPADPPHHFLITPASTLSLDQIAGKIMKFCFGPQHLYSAQDQNLLICVNLETHATDQSVLETTATHLIANENFLVYGDAETIFVCHPQELTPLNRFEFAAPAQLSLSGHKLAACSNSGSLNIWNAESGELCWNRNGTWKECCALAHNDTLIAVGTISNLLVYDYSRDQLRYSLTQKGAFLSFHDSYLLAAYTKHIAIWFMTNGNREITNIDIDQCFDLKLEAQRLFALTCTGIREIPTNI